MEAWLGVSLADDGKTALQFLKVPMEFWVSIVYPIEMIVLGGLLGALVFAIYLSLAYGLGKVNYDWVFSSQRIADYKCFLRMRFEPDKLTIYPIGLDSVPAATAGDGGGTPPGASAGGAEIAAEASADRGPDRDPSRRGPRPAAILAALAQHPAPSVGAIRSKPALERGRPPQPAPSSPASARGEGSPLDGRCRPTHGGGMHATHGQPGLAVVVLEQHVDIELRHDTPQALVASQALDPDMAGPEIARHRNGPQHQSDPDPRPCQSLSTETVASKTGARAEPDGLSSAEPRISPSHTKPMTLALLKSRRAT